MRNLRIPLVVVGAFLLLQSSCEQNNQNIPYVPVNFDLNLNLPSYNSLNYPGEHLILQGGSKGIVVYRYTTDEFVVLDRHSTFDVTQGCNVTVESDGITLSDDNDCSNSKWIVLDGSVMQGPATLSLHRYRTNWNPPILHVYN
tara:strand:+ start:261 stop:689 length:429 start_codon:yes stop_codon:yes gene_type:complete